MQSSKSCTDRDLIRTYIRGDERAFETLLTRHKGKIYTSIYMFVKDTDLANDIFQETFIKIIDTFRSGKYNEEGKFLQWALRISYNLCIDFFRKNKRRKTITPSEDFDIFNLINSNEDNEESKMIKNQTYAKVRQLVEALPQEQKEVILLRHYAELSFKEIAELTNVSINTALGRMRYALINIRKMIGEHQISLQ
ncbi:MULTISPECIES: RNA polymerase sigma factor [unclassified Aureispira]|uniref:RNA polymerase sigma factor n=1 Tax=unclassified Aureispira TaxID=2649989 RepID=UPI000698D4FD|nr:MULTISPECIES: sigma-70 family RNA polymerase sigma factor [unclassified Aureispira]WMX14901.1 sigma-70 family RNA polymerase sigma factor [Aureispira sp. CCB-E]